jgi:hypothetical protein
MGLFTAPFRGLLRVFEEVAAKAEHDLHDADAVRAELSELYFKLEAHTLSEEEFGRREAELVERLEEIAIHEQRRNARGRR